MISLLLIRFFHIQTPPQTGADRPLHVLAGVLVILLHSGSTHSGPLTAAALISRRKAKTNWHRTRPPLAFQHVSGWRTSVSSAVYRATPIVVPRTQVRNRSPNMLIQVHVGISYNFTGYKYLVGLSGSTYKEIKLYFMPYMFTGRSSYYIY